MTRADDITRFVAGAGWGDATRLPLAGDASARRYERLNGPRGAAILMDADPATGEQTQPFLTVAAHLTAHGFSAPQILAHDAALGLILMEDLGDDLVTHVCAQDPQDEPAIYAETARMLAALHAVPVPGWARPYGPAQMGPMIDLFFAHHTDMPARDVTHAVTDALTATDIAPHVLILRDFHAENLLWLPQRTGFARLGLLDFQDALAGHPAYDLASLIQDARRDVSRDAARAAVHAFCDATGHDTARIEGAIATQGAQRNLRILGIFARLARQGRTKYTPLLPRVEAHLAACLAHPAASGIARALAAHGYRPT